MLYTIVSKRRARRAAKRRAIWVPGKHDASSQRCFNVGLSSRNIKTPFVYCHVFAGMDTMDIYSRPTHHVRYRYSRWWDASCAI